MNYKKMFIKSENALIPFVLSMDDSFEGIYFRTF